MENLKLSHWPDEASDVFTGDGLLDGLPPPVRSSGLDFLLGGARGQGDALTIGQVDPDRLVLGRPEGNDHSVRGPKNPIGPVQGYPETGKDSWRASNDDVIVAAVNKYNAENRYFPGDVAYMTPKLMKAWMMRESGGSPNAFRTDPFQVNKPLDYPKSDEKKRIADLARGQVMTPQTSADAALKWLYYKGHVDSRTGRLVPYQGHYEALRNYNAAPGHSDGISKKSEYANDVLNHAWISYGDWQE